MVLNANKCWVNNLFIFGTTFLKLLIALLGDTIFGLYTSLWPAAYMRKINCVWIQGK
jgi:hypothetical protein